MKNKHRVIITMVLVAMIIGLLAGCNGGTTTTTGTSGTTAGTTKSTTTSAGTTTTGAAGPVTAAGTFPIVEEPVALKVFYVPTAFIEDMNTNKATLWLEEKTNIDLEFETTTQADGATKLSLLLATNSNMPDIFLTSYASAAVVGAYGSQGVILQLDDLIEEYGFNCKKLWDKMGEGAQSKCASYDGHYYYLPRYAISFHGSADQKLWINNSWVEAVGMSLPTTTEEFYNLLKAFKEQDANGNGDVNDEIPFICTADGWNQSVPLFLMNSFVFSNGLGDLYLEDDGVVHASYYEDGWREGLKFYNKLYAENLLDEESFVITSEQAKALASDPNGNRIGCFPGGYSLGIIAQESEDVFDYVAVEPLTGPTGLKQTPSTSMNPSCWFYISASTEYPEAAFRLGDALMFDLPEMLDAGDYEWMNFMYGPEGEGWRKAKPDELGLSGEPASYTWVFKWGDTMNLHWYENYNCYMPIEYKNYMAISAAEGYDLEKVLYDETMDKYHVYRTYKKMPPLSMSEEEIAESSEVSTALSTYRGESMSKFVTGVLDPSSDTDWNAYITELENIGVKRYIELNQQAYDRQYGG